jgi:hypothetical protein
MAVMNRSADPLPLRWLAAARIAGLAYIILTLLSIFIDLPERYARLRLLEPGTVQGTPFYGWSSEQIHAVMAELNLSPDLIAGVMFASSLFCLACFFGVGGLLFWRRSNSWIGLLAALILFGTGPGFAQLLASQSVALPWLSSLYSSSAVLIWLTFFIFLYLFPNGKFVPRFTRYLTPLPFLAFILSLFQKSIPAMDSIVSVLIAGYAFGGLFSQVYRYRRVSGLVERQQTKWVISALGIFLVVLLLGLLTPPLFPSIAVGTPQGFWYDWAANGWLGVLVPALIPLAIGISILRYRLFDIDLIIRRTLQYGVLTALLALLYFGIVTVLQGIFTALGGSQSPVITVISTLAIYALFNPLRRRLQEMLDRRFYRQKYNAEKALADFAASARNQTDLQALTHELQAVVQTNMQPERLSIWMRPTAEKRAGITR